MTKLKSSNVDLAHFVSKAAILTRYQNVWYKLGTSLVLLVFVMQNTSLLRINLIFILHGIHLFAGTN